MNLDSFPLPLPTLRPLADDAARAYLAELHRPKSQHPLISFQKAMLKSRIDISALTLKAELIDRRLSRIEHGSLPCTAVVNDFYPHDLEVLKPIYISIEPDGEEFIATFHDAEVSASGETHAEALCNLKDYIAILFDDLSAEDPNLLGPGPKRQLEVLNRYLSLSR